jgi:hypothetical protein
MFNGLPNEGIDYERSIPKNGNRAIKIGMEDIFLPMARYWPFKES